MIEFIIIFLLIIALAFSVYKNFKMGMTILKMEDAIEDCLDVIDEKYEKMTEILGRPLFYDSSEVKQVVQDIKSVKESLHSVALSLTQNIEEDHGEE